MSTTRSIAVRAGLVGGLMFSVHISIPGCGNWPFLWPAVAGGSALWMASDAGVVHRLRRGILTTLATGAIVALTGLVAVSLIVFVVARSQFRAVAAASDLHSRASVVTQAELTIATLCMLALVATVLGALAAMPALWLRHRRSSARAA